MLAMGAAADGELLAPPSNADGEILAIAPSAPDGELQPVAPSAADGGLLAALRDKEEGLLALVAQLSSARALASLAMTSHWTREAALAAADERVRVLIQSERSVSRWRRNAYCDGGDVVREAHHVECAVAYIGRLAGRYRLSATVVLDIAPTGDYVNYSTGSIDMTPGVMALGAAQTGHCFRGVTTVAGVLTVPGHDDFLYLLDRWYTSCWQGGYEVPAASLGFVGEGYQCYSVSALQEGGVRDGQHVPVIYENRPGPLAERAWRVHSSEPVLWRPLPGEYGPQPYLDYLARHPLLGTSGDEEGIPLMKVAERLEAWPVGGLPPLADTRDNEHLRARYPPRQHYEQRLADLRL
jgi:hypothetical protein